MPRRYSFPESGCAECQYHQLVGAGLLQTRYCGGFPKRKKPKRFSRSDPQIKAPKWCPRRVWPPVCRIYGFSDERSRDIDTLTRSAFDPKRDRFISVYAGHYKLRREMTVSMKAKAFFESVGHGDLDDFLVETDIQIGEVVEIDDGLKPYCFYYMGWPRLIPIFRFDRTQVRKGE